MKVAILGAGGGLGQEIVREALERGHQLQILIRNEQQASRYDKSVSVVVGDARSRAALSQVFRGADVVISALGGAPHGKVANEADLLHHATEAIVSTMQELHVDRLIYTSAWGVGDSVSHTTALFRYVIKPLVVKDEYLDKEIQEQLIAGSPLNWTIVRPTILTNGSSTGYVSGNPLSFAWWRNAIPPRISRSDVARFIFDELATTSQYQRSAVMVSGKSPL